MSDPNDDDWLLARELLEETSECWTPEVYSQLCELVKRNELVGSPLGREGYIVMRDLLWAVAKLRLAQTAAMRWQYDTADSEGDDAA